MKTKSGGLNQISVRSFNERLVLSLLCQHGALSRQDLGKRSGLSAQTVSVIVRALEKDGMILPGEKVRGRVGPPTIPMALNPDGAFAIGFELGRTSARMSVVDFTGCVRSMTHVAPADRSLGKLIASMAETAIRRIDCLTEDRRSRLVGLGVAMHADMAPSDVSLGEEIEDTFSEATGLPIFLQNDVTCAASAEVSFGSARLLDDFIYLFVDSTVGCRLVLGGHIFSGRTSVALTRQGAGNLNSLAFDLGLGRQPVDFWAHEFEWGEHGEATAAWSQSAAMELVATIRSALAFVDAKTVVVDGRLPAAITGRLVALIEEGLADQPELALEVVQGAIGESAKTIGAANLALNQAYMV
ncbi:ROK family protein [Phaeobacter inhibens]|uniref:ROK family transcriptional regulator n=1 Tax=Phaeobacter inhibens TaxID=221822 RepID=UPI0021A3B1B2|nr:ROK family transcriptional regulator [Phaeobacter inhibens]UWS04307.1 ROK family protein [Phaeobacter inhibens]